MMIIQPQRDAISVYCSSIQVYVCYVISVHCGSIQVYVYVYVISVHCGSIQVYVYVYVISVYCGSIQVYVYVMLLVYTVVVYKFMFMWNIKCKWKSVNFSWTESMK